MRLFGPQLAFWVWTDEDMVQLSKTCLVPKLFVIK